MTDDDLLSRIDELIDDSLERGDQSDSFHGEQYIQDHPCPWCGKGWHFLAITEQLEAMRRGSYGTDEFGQGIVDPDYRYDRDSSPIICPGSEYHGPIHISQQWSKERREKWEEYSKRNIEALAKFGRFQARLPSIPDGELHRWRFVGPYDSWTVELNDERRVEVINVPDPDGARRDRAVVTDIQLNAAFRWEGLFPIPEDIAQSEFVVLNSPDIQDLVYMAGVAPSVRLRTIKIPFLRMEIHHEAPPTPDQAAGIIQYQPLWVEFITPYDILQHVWWRPYWEDHGVLTDEEIEEVKRWYLEEGSEPIVSFDREGERTDYVVIDEAYQYVDQIQSVTTSEEAQD